MATEQDFIWKAEHQQICRAMFDLVHENDGLIPTTKQLRQKTGFTAHKINKHKPQIRLDNISDDYRVITPRVLMGMADSAIAGNAQSAKLWLQVVEGWVEKKELTGAGGGPLEVTLTRRVVGADNGK